MTMFACAIAANLSYGLGILIRSYQWKEFVSSAPWLLGSLGTVTLDVVIFCQVGRSTILLCFSATLVCYIGRPANLVHAAGPLPEASGCRSRMLLSLEGLSQLQRHAVGYAVHYASFDLITNLLSVHGLLAGVPIRAGKVPASLRCRTQR